ncbi:MAG: DUF1707 domain-containing protein [Propioniciclava sp.]|uniref:DUF1707 SHOCT-like domain-containing protein n=1 Tax=Propioniciclava sp. TaxID=2038686 RepID=UPI0039E45196
MSESPRDRHLRIGHPQRDHALDILRSAAADGRLEFDELEHRTTRALAAVTRADLAEVLHDLVPSAELDNELGAGVPIGEGPGYSWDDPLLLRGDQQPVRVGGPWVAPPFIEVVCGWRSSLIDFTQSHPTSPVIDIVIGGQWGGLTIIIPDGWGADLQGIQADGSSYTTSSVPTRPRRGLTRLVVRGRSTGGVAVRTPTARDLRRAASGKLRPPAEQVALPPASPTP